MGALVRLAKAALTRPAASPKNIPATTAVGMVFSSAKVGKVNAKGLRQWSRNSEWLRAAVGVRKTQVSSADWDIVDFNPDVQTDNKRVAKRVKSIFDTPNPRSDSFRTFIEPIVEDILTLDAGCVEKVRTLRGDVAELWAVDGGTVKVNALWDGDPKEPRYFWWPDWKERARWYNADFTYMMANPNTYTPVGLSPVETLAQVIDSELGAQEYNRRQVMSAAPDGLLDLGEGFRPEQVEAFKSYWLAEIAGKGAMAFLGGSKNAKFVPFRPNNRDMQFLEWQIYLVRKIAAVMQISPQDLGVTFDINRAEGQVQQELTEDRGLRPLLGLIQDYFTREVVWDDAFGGPDNNLAFRFTALNLKETTAKAKVNEIALGGAPWKTINEARKEDGREPMGPAYDGLIMATPVGAVSIEDVMTAREAMEMKKPAPAVGNGVPSKAIVLPGDQSLKE